MGTYRALGFIFCSAKLISIIFAFTVAALQSVFELHVFSPTHHHVFLFKNSGGKMNEIGMERNESRC